MIAAFFIISFVLIVLRDFDEDYLIVPRGTQAMHFAYWTYFVLTVDVAIHSISVIIFNDKYARSQMKSACKFNLKVYILYTLKTHEHKKYSLPVLREGSCIFIELFMNT